MSLASNIAWEGEGAPVATDEVFVACWIIVFGTGKISSTNRRAICCLLMASLARAAQDGSKASFRLPSAPTLSCGQLPDHADACEDRQWPRPEGETLAGLDNLHGLRAPATRTMGGERAVCHRDCRILGP